MSWGLGTLAWDIHSQPPKWTWPWFGAQHLRTEQTKGKQMPVRASSKVLEYQISGNLPAAGTGGGAERTPKPKGEESWFLIAKAPGEHRDFLRPGRKCVCVGGININLGTRERCDALSGPNQRRDQSLTGR